MTKAKRNTTGTARTASIELRRQLIALWNIHGATGASEESDRKTGNAIATLERLILQVPARSADDALLQMAIICLDLQDAAEPGPNWCPPDYQTLSDVLGAAVYALMSALNVSAESVDLINGYIRDRKPEHEVQESLCAVERALGV